MTSDSGLTSQDTDDTKHIQEVLDELQQMQQIPRLVTSPDALEALEREFVNAPIGWGAYWSGITCSTRWIRRPYKPHKHSSYTSGPRH